MKQLHISRGMLPHELRVTMFWCLWHKAVLARGWLELTAVTPHTQLGRWLWEGSMYDWACQDPGLPLMFHWSVETQWDWREPLPKQCCYLCIVHPDPLLRSQVAGQEVLSACLLHAQCFSDFFTNVTNMLQSIPAWGSWPWDK